MAPTLYWYDYETFGTDPARDRPAQFAGQRTDLDLNPVGEPLSLYCRPANDYLPQPEACLITGITPQIATSKGECEAHFISRIDEQFSHPETCVTGYNNIRFDDEVTRYTLYRNLFDPYAREWRNGNSRWDLIDVIRLTYALRPEGIQWPRREDGAPSFKLEHLTAANGIAHDQAHDALADVQATIGLARLLRSRHPRLYQFCFSHRRKNDLWPLLNLDNWHPVLHVSEKYPAQQGCLAMVAPLGPLPNNPNGVVVYNLEIDPREFEGMNADTLRERLFTPRQDLPEGRQRLPLKTVRVNRCPVLAPLSVLRPSDAMRLGIDIDECLQHLDRLKARRDDWLAVLPEIFQPQDSLVETKNQDPDLMLYSGGFFSDADRLRLSQIRNQPPSQLTRLRPEFDDPRLEEMVFRYRARNFPETLNAEEMKHWNQYRQLRLSGSIPGANLNWQEFQRLLRHLRQRSESIQRDLAILEALESYGESLLKDLDSLPSD